MYPFFDLSFLARNFVLGANGVVFNDVEVVVFGEIDDIRRQCLIACHSNLLN